jgi:hypothetical protein
VDFAEPLLQVLQRNSTSDIVELITNFELLVEQCSVWTQEAAHQVALAQVEGL